MLEQIAAWVGEETTGPLCDSGMSAEAVANALGTAHSKALLLLLTARGQVMARTTASARDWTSASRDATAVVLIKFRCGRPRHGALCGDEVQDADVFPPVTVSMRFGLPG
ncbi:hypothetical protein [Streptomyces sp. TBY4]|uniref:hypothetical protein n=1 Tax=Streptomyces sp. TBY4 TaxID=2962030 RepID=UPI0020B71504|nr:hypothetical protein [Streptomyces sp. TBY4]MCP3759145.1 hypothetical protein [Streptomyces sp. TBY4]